MRQRAASMNLVPFVCLLTQKSWRAAEDVSDTVPRERALKSVSFQESVSVITDRPATMELESQQIQHGCLSSPSNRAHNAVGVKVETPDNEVVQVCRVFWERASSTVQFVFICSVIFSEIMGLEILSIFSVLVLLAIWACHLISILCLSFKKRRTSTVALHTVNLLCLQEIRYLDQVLDAASETPTNGTSSPSENTRPISIDGNSPSVFMSPSSPVNHQSIIVEGQRQTTFLHQEDPAVKTNGHVQGEESGRGGAKFELRAFQEERRPAKLFTPGEEQQVRVTRRRPTEEVNDSYIMCQL